MIISSKLYSSESLLKRKEKIIKKIEKNKAVLRLYVITNAFHKDNQLEIHYYNEMFQKVLTVYYDYTIYGIAKSKDEAFELLEQMVNDCIKERGDCDLREFLKS